ncbi:MAG: hypothetical protein JO117_10445 [Verrucomicrobia bacterium]|nr:hypothetical protein [Verrucomicrobiota bacterium]MBV9658318.1 hypothetical protein [Verrucomicrobiota bacterium]
MKIVEQFEDAARQLKTEAQIRKVLAGLNERTGGQPRHMASLLKPDDFPSIPPYRSALPLHPAFADSLLSGRWPL